MQMSLCKLQMQAQPAVQIPPRGPKLGGFGQPRRPHDKVVVVMGATGTGKSRLSIDLATRFWPAEVVNSDKMQVYQGLDVITNKITEEEQRGVPHHLLGTVKNPNADFTADDFCSAARGALDGILAHRGLPIVVGGSNSFIERLVEDDQERDWCFLWVDVELPVLHAHVSDRVDEMVRNGMVQEARALFDPACASYARGLRRAIGVPEFDQYFRAPEDLRALREAISEVKENTIKLACRQLRKIEQLGGRKGWSLHRLDATEVYRQKPRGPAEAERAWQRHVAGPGTAIVSRFLRDFVPEFAPLPLSTTRVLLSTVYH